MADDARKPKAAPYHFVPTRPELAVTDQPVLHDKADLADLKGTWTGELRCTLRALTPLLAANDQYTYAQASELMQRAIDDMVAQRLQGCAPGATGFVSPKKRIVEPLALPGPEERPDIPGPILIAGASLKGMIRQSLAALLAAPLERVGERTFSYRPNVKLPGKSDPLHLTTEVGVVAHAEKNEGSLRVWSLGRITDLGYIRPEEVPSRLAELKGVATVQAAVAAVRQAATPDAVLLALASLTTGDDRYLLPCRTGLDGEGILQEAFNRSAVLQDRTRRYDWVLVPRLQLAKKPDTIVPAPLVRGWRETLAHLRDKDHGHLRMHPVAEEQDIARAETSITRLLEEGFRPGDIVFFEKQGTRVVTLGHHFRYRWRYRDSIRFYTPQPSAQTTIGATLRDVLCPPSLRVTPGAPQALTGASLLFGHAAARADEDERGLTTNTEHTKSAATKPSPSDFSHLAGRIAINMAVENVAESNLPNLEPRFLNAGSHCLVPLRALGSPKPSAVEQYLEQDPNRLEQRQDQGLLCTYGDEAADGSAGRLRGRKFYLHSPAAGSDPELYELLPHHRPKYPEDCAMLTSDQAGIARFISRRGSAFTFTLRFINLRPWELGCLLFVVSAKREDIETLLTWLEVSADDIKPLGFWFDCTERKQRKQPSDPLLALKLGHGRPLGLGSVQVAVDEIHRLVIRNGDQIELERREMRAELIDEFAAKLADDWEDDKRRRWVEEILLPWLQVHRYVGRRHYPYPRDPETKTIFDRHTALRTEHAFRRKLKRHQRQPGSKTPGLPTLDELDKQEG